MNHYDENHQAKLERMEELGRMLRNIRRRKDFTQERVGTSGGYSARILRKIECGQMMPSRLRLIRLGCYGLELDRRDVNKLLITAGYARLSDAEARQFYAVGQSLAGSLR